MLTLLIIALVLTPLATNAATSQEPVPSASATATATAPVPSTPGLLQAKPTIGTRDWWSHLSRDEKLRVVEGAIDGLINGWWRAFTDYDTKVMVIIIKTDVKSTNAKVWLAVDNELGKASEDEKRSVPTFSKKLGFYIDGIDHFYEAYPQATQVTVGEILQCLSDKPWKSCADVAKIFSGPGR